LRAQTPVIPPPRDVAGAADSVMMDSSSAERPVGGLRPGDLLRVAVYREKELTGEYLIDSRGFVQIPGIGIIRVAGFDPTQARQRLIDALRLRGIADPEISVQPLVQVSVLGEVRTPNLYPVEPGTSLLQVITRAGGPTDRANLRKARVVRDGRAFVVDLESGLTGSAAGRVILYSNDFVVIPRRTGVTRENVTFALTTAGLLLTVLNVYLTAKK
jgi:polysaccharide export outer membrane protein